MPKLSISINTTQNSNPTKLFVQLCSLFYEVNEIDVFDQEMQYRKLIKSVYQSQKNYDQIKSLTLSEVMSAYENNNFKRIYPDNIELIFVIDNNTTEEFCIGNILEINNQKLIKDYINEFIIEFNKGNLFDYKIIEPYEKINISISRNLAIQNASGLYIMFCDDDDIHSPVSYAFTLIDKANKEKLGFDAIDARNQCVKSENLGAFKTMMGQNGIWSYIFSLEFIKRYNIYFIPSFSVTEDGLLIKHILGPLSMQQSGSDTLKGINIYIAQEESSMSYFYLYLICSSRYSLCLDDKYRDFIIASYLNSILINFGIQMKAQMLALTAEKLSKMKSHYHNDNPRHKDEVVLAQTTSYNTNNLYSKNTSDKLMFITNYNRKSKIEDIKDWRKWNETVRNDLYIKNW